MIALLFGLSSIAAAFDHQHTVYQSVLDRWVSAGNVDYAGLAADAAPLDGYLVEVARATPTGMTPEQKKAFYLNAYNALTLDLVAGAYPIRSILELDAGKVWDTRKFTVAGASITLNDLENRMLRTLGDPRIHAALNCASRGCPALAAKVFRPETLDAQLEQAAKVWVASTSVRGQTVTISKIFDWFGDDFVPMYGASYQDLPGLEGKQEAALNFISRYAPERAATIKAGNLTIQYLDYDWSLNNKP